jgi:3-mercaptopyruvate sulfurtransferase SseA
VQKTLELHLLVAFVAGIALAPPLPAAEVAQGNLVSTEWLAQNRADVLILDASPPPLHAKQHIPGAIPVDVFTLASFGVRDTPLPRIETIYQAMGLDSAKTVVLYDQGGTWFAARVFFSLSYHGFPTAKLFILDGGMAKWQAEGLPVTKEPTARPSPGTFRITRIDEALRVRPAELVAGTGDRAHTVPLDALGPEYHYGAAAFFNKAGHIPHAVLLPSEDFFHADKTYKSQAEIQRMLAHLGVRPDQEIHSHCGGGGAAAVPYFALKHIAGYPKVKLSVESQMGWLQDDRDLPFWTYDAPAMMRDADWLASWGGKMMRMYGMSRVSVIDVRPAGAYAQSHLPFALNVPAEAFRRNVANPAKLAEMLGAAGLDASHEAVVLSGSGLSKEAALAFVMLEQAGQRKVSVFIEPIDSVDTLDKLARRDFAVVKEPTKIVPTSYPRNVREGAAIGDSRASPGIDPKVFIASGARVPDSVPDGKVVHVPYTELLQPDGKPKDAKDLWAILSKAGVPRYAELVAFSEDPGEAATLYFVLKLMGYPNVKMLVT